MSVLEACAVAVTAYTGILVWLLVDVVRVQVETSRFLLERARKRSATPSPTKVSLV